MHIQKKIYRKKYKLVEKKVACLLWPSFHLRFLNTPYH